MKEDDGSCSPSKIQMQVRNPGSRPRCPTPKEPFRSISPSIAIASRTVPLPITNIGANPQWEGTKGGRVTPPTIEFKQQVLDNNLRYCRLKEPIPAITHGKSIYDLSSTPNPPGWWNDYKHETKTTFDYRTSGSKIAEFPPNVFTMPITNFTKDRSFTNDETSFPRYKNRSLNVNKCKPIKK